MGNVYRSGAIGNNNYDRRSASLASAYVETEKGRTVQAEKDQSDINVILRNFGVTGMLPQRVAPPLPADFIDIIDYRSALDAIRAADSAFLSFPAAVRSQFGNDPAAFVDFAGDPKNLPQLVEWGLAPAKSGGSAAPGGTPAATAGTVST